MSDPNAWLWAEGERLLAKQGGEVDEQYCAELEEDGSCIHSDHMAAAEVAEISKLIDGDPWKA
jgi:hypothetical protein